MNPHFAEPRWLWLAVLAPLALVALQSYSTWARKKQLARIAAPDVVQDLTRSHSPIRRGLKHILLVLAVGSIGLALARPQWGEHKITEQSLGEDVVFVLDCSRSMLATDVTPNRLQRARLAILDFMRARGTGRVGLVAFAGNAFLQCPLTFDYSAFEETLIAVDEKTIPVLGTDIGTALEEGFMALDKNNRRKLLVVLTDGEDLEKGGVREAEKLSKAGVVVYTVGVGTPAGHEIEIVNERGKPELLRDNRGEVVRSRLDEATLRSIAEATHGSYFPLGSLGEGLVKVRLGIQNLESNFGFAPAHKQGVDRFHIFIAAVVLLLVVESLIGTRRRSHFHMAAQTQTG
jgi:Ca-activated chloride channel family protein